MTMVGTRHDTVAARAQLRRPARRAPRAMPTTLLPLALLTCCGGGPQLDGPVDGDRAMAHVRHLVETIGPRPFGSDNLAKAANYITGELTELGLQPKRHEVVDAKENKTIRNLYVQIDGKDPANGPILMIGAHYDTKLTDGHDKDSHNFPFVGAIDGGGAPAVLLELARVLKDRQPRLEPNVWLYWIDAEESIDFHWNTERALLGSKAFCSWLSKEKILSRVKAFVLLDLIGDKDIKIDEDGKSNDDLQEIFRKVAVEKKITDRVYKFESSATDDHETFINYGVPSVLLIDFHLRIPEHLIKETSPNARIPDPQGYQQWWHTPEDTIDKMSPQSLQFAGNLVWHALPGLEAFVKNRK
ncbi:MAG: M28 family peptidase [Planctomycetota bacterium]